MLQAAAMRPVSAETDDILNFAVVGEVRSGAAVVQSSIDGAFGAVCHADLLHPKEAIRRQCHCRYFGAGDASAPDWYIDGGNPQQYLAHRVFSQARGGEAAVGLRILYPQIRKHELYDLFEERGRAGSFCLVHVIRNPIACYVSLEQARRSRLWSCSPQQAVSPLMPAPITVHLDELVRFVRDHFATRAKLDRSCEDRITVHYRELFTDFAAVMRRVYGFLELPIQSPAPATRRRLRNRPMRERISNFDPLYREAPGDIRRLLEDDLF